uniref:Transcription factor TFIIB cyclin-like domain-containing protein n=1 Tax=Ananas comosus var. bracteatus TaxID=296719 RepID=A0A6V7NP66_ANACO|nr:unnamed protein product [Ananas comosus var. bracteatus]
MATTAAATTTTTTTPSSPPASSPPSPPGPSRPPPSSPAPPSPSPATSSSSSVAVAAAEEEEEGGGGADPSGPLASVDNLRAYRQISDNASILGLDHDIADHAFELFRDCSSAICLRNRSVEALATAALVQAIREAQEHSAEICWWSSVAEISC